MGMKCNRNPLATRLYRGLKRTKRAVLNRRGDGVHSPFAFDLIRQVFRNPHPYTAFTELGIMPSEHKYLAKLYGDRLLKGTRSCELIFRLVHRLAKGEVLLIAPKDSLLPKYIQATGKVQVLNHTSNVPRGLPRQAMPSTIIIEDLLPEDLPHLEQLLHTWRACRDGIIILHHHNPVIRKLTPRLRSIAMPDATFDSLDVELWVCRHMLTKGHYKVYH